mmetsp:Transcript_48606/g.112926  ORF Transcript_48606/g.112926 Transcript_48606/m.112926 type:complete len:235 (-) Transcript_48606:9-713(-)
MAMRLLGVPKGVAKAQFAAKMTMTPRMRGSKPWVSEMLVAMGIISTATAVPDTTCVTRPPAIRTPAQTPMVPKPAISARDTKLAATVRATPVFSIAVPRPTEAAMPRKALTLIAAIASRKVRTSKMMISAAAMTHIVARGADLSQMEPSFSCGMEMATLVLTTQSAMATERYARSGSALRPMRGGVDFGTGRTMAKMPSDLASKPCSSASTRRKRPMSSPLLFEVGEASGDSPR